MNKKGGFTDLFLLMIVALIIVLVSGVFIYLGGVVSDQLHDTMDDMDVGGEKNGSELIDENFGAVNVAYGGLYWISVLLIVGMIISTFIGSYLVTTKPVFFIPFIFVLIIAIVVAVGLSNAYETIITDPTLADTFAGFVGANYILANLPIWITVVGVTGAIIMFVRMGREQEGVYYG